MTTKFYPKSLTKGTKNLTNLTASYKFRAFLAIIAILLFFILYSALVIGLGYLLYYAVIYDMRPINKLTILLKVGAIAGAAMLFVFTLKFIFKLKNHKPKNRIKLNKDKYPEIWGFVNEICMETGAPKPKSIYVDPDVNAYVSYTNMWLSLFLPVSKELTIGLGLVDCVNLSEFKAVISHEFGHFAQRSMKIGSYIISANTIIHDMIFSRDKWDNILDQWRASDIRLSAAAWVITPVIWIIRQLLNLFYQFLNIMNSSLSREMEFNADKVAVSTSGSDAIISALWKLDEGSVNWNKTMNHAYLASHKKMFATNLYRHNVLSIARGEEKQRNLLSSLPEDLRGGKHYFSNSEVSKVGMYASHPPNDMRENNAKSPYVSCEEDKRLPWVLFERKETLQEEMTKLLYKEYLNKTPENYVSEEVFEKFIKDETTENDLFEEYDNTFVNRFVSIPEVSTLIKKAEELPSVNKSFIKKMKTDLSLLLKPVTELETLMERANQIAEGTTKEKEFSVQGITYNRKNLQQGYEYLINQRNVLFEETFKDWDSQFFTAHYVLAKSVNEEIKLLKNYQQHRSIVTLYKGISETKESIFKQVNNLQEQEEVTQGIVNALGHNIKRSVKELNEKMSLLGDVDFVPMPNIDTLEELKHAIVEEGNFKVESGDIFENGGFDIMVNMIETSLGHCQRLDQKSMGCILEFHKKLQEKSLLN